MEENLDDVLIQETYLCKSISGEEDENGNYKFEVEASNENLDLQNQITLQSALKKSEEYFITNGVISDDHLHKTRYPDGSVETHKDKIIGEPLSVRFDTDTKKTYVKGILYSGIEAAKPYIELLKNKSRLVKASLGGIMPKIKKNADGSETVTSFIWNDLALTCSPINWTVGGAKFAKSIAVEEFCKSLNAGYGTDSAGFEGGRSLQKEDIEEETANIMDMTDGNLHGESEKDDVEKSDNDIIRDCIIAIDNGELKTKESIENFLTERGFSKDKAEETTLEIITQGDNKMAKGNFSTTIDEILKSIKSDKEDETAKKLDVDEIDESDMEDDKEVSKKDDDLTDDSEDDEEIEKNCMKKSVDENDYFDATELIKSIGERIDELEAEKEQMRDEFDELQKSLVAVTKSFADYASIPNERNTVMQKSISGNAVEKSANVKPTEKDLDVLKSCLVKACKEGEITVNDVQFYNSQFQKSMKDEPMQKGAWGEICNIVKKYR